MPTVNSKAWESGEQQPVACAICDKTARRDEALLDALQQARFILSSSHVLLDPAARLERAKLAINEAMRLMQPVRW